MSLQELTTTTPARSPVEPKHDKRERISPKVAKAVRLLVTGECKTQKAAAERVGMNATYLCEQLGKPKIQAFIARETRKTISAGTMRAGARLLELVDAASEHVSLDASKHVLAIEGIRPPDDSRHVSVNVGVSVGYVIDTSRRRAGGPITTHERSGEQDQALIATRVTDAT